MSLNPSNGIAARMNSDKTMFRNLARRTKVWDRGLKKDINVPDVEAIYKEVDDTVRVYKLSPEREVRFDAVRRWRFDFAFPDEKLAVEVEGGTWQAGRHQRGGGFAEDCVKYNAATVLGWRILRYTTDQVESGEAIQQVREILK
jgi:very-short-patch-repair endonuclease